MSQFFDEPEEVTGVRLNPADIVGHVLLVWAIEYKDHSPTRFTQEGKKSDVIVVDLVDLDLYDDDDKPGYLARRQWWRQGRLIQVLRPKIGSPRPMLVVMDKGTGTQGYAAPYVLTSVSGDAECVNRANDWFARHPGHEPSLPEDKWAAQQQVDAWEPKQTRPAAQAEKPASNPVLDRLRAQAERNKGRLPKPPDEPGF